MVAATRSPTPERAQTGRQRRAPQRQRWLDESSARPTVRFVKTTSSAVALPREPKSRCAAGLVWLVGGALVLGCASGETLPSPPTATLGQSVAAQLAYRPLEQAWREGSGGEREALEPKLTKFVQSFPTDPEARQVQVWLGWLALSKNRLDVAQSFADKASVDKVGSTFEAAQVLRAAILTRRGQPEQSLALLEPLSGKIIDARERDTWAREIIRADLRLKHDDDALKWALVWRLESSEDRRASTDREINLVLDQVSRPALDRLWSQLVSAERIATTSPTRKQGRIWMREAVTQRLARFAIDSRDSTLARRLLNDAWLPLQNNTNLRRLARVAARGEADVQNLTRAVGVIVELDDAEQRRRSSDLLTGMLQTLGELEAPNSVRLHTHEAPRGDQQAYAKATEDLYNEGVALVVGGFEPDSARTLAAQARAKMLPVIALARLAEPLDSVFFFDTSDHAITERWLQTTSSPIAAARVVTDQDPVCAADADAPCALWHKARVERVLLACGELCAQHLGQSAADAAWTPAVWLGPKAGEAADFWRDEQVKGVVTFSRFVTPHAGDLDRWRQRFARLPSYYEVLGHDVAALAMAALREFPNSVAPDPASREKALRSVAARLAGARAALWSGESTGFGPDRSLVPTFLIEPRSPRSQPRVAPGAPRGRAPTSSP
jgi:hypothetical protein